ncbi:MAG: hypothetical protein ACLGIJ_12885 [Candidatus Limnocylindria bacterium]
MRARRFELRLLAVGLAAAWAAAAGLVILAYRPGGPLDLAVGIALLLPIGIALAAVRWPPVTRGAGSFPLMVSLGVTSLLLLVPSIRGVMDQILQLGSQTLMPSLEAAYPWALALLSTSLFAAFGLVRMLDGGAALRRRRFVVGSALGLAMSLVAGGSFAAIAIANEIGLRDGARPAGSRFGPVGEGTLPTCDGPLATGATARVSLRLEGEVDLRSIGSVDISGHRAGSDFRWLAFVATGREIGLYGQVWTEGRAFTRVPSKDWQQVGSNVVAEGDLDARVAATVLTDAYRSTAEDRGEEVLEGARARRCRVSIDGPAFVHAFPQVRWLVGDASLERWRGQLDYWLFLDGQLGQVVGSVNGEAIGIRPDALQATVNVSLTATDRGRPVVIYPPIP